MSEGDVAFEMTLGDPRVRHVFATETEGALKRLIEPASVKLFLRFDPGISRLTITDKERGTEVLTWTLDVAFPATAKNSQTMRPTHATSLSAQLPRRQSASFITG